MFEIKGRRIRLTRGDTAEILIRAEGVTFEPEDRAIFTVKEEADAGRPVHDLAGERRHGGHAARRIRVGHSVCAGMHAGRRGTDTERGERDHAVCTAAV